MNIIKSNLQDLKKIVKENEVSSAIQSAQGRTIMSEVVVSTPNKYSNISNVKLMNGFGSDMITLKKYDYMNFQMEKYNQFSEVSSLIGLNLELKEEGIELDTFCDEHLSVIDFKTVDYIVITMYPQQGIKLSFAEKEIKKLRKLYSGFIFLNYYVQNPHLFKKQIEENISWISNCVNMISVPIPGTVYGINETVATEIIKLAHEHKLLVAGTICTSQEGAESNIMSNLGLTAKACGFDVHMFGDASACDIPLEENVFEYSKVIRGKRHTYFRMNA